MQGGWRLLACRGLMACGGLPVNPAAFQAWAAAVSAAVNLDSRSSLHI